jgi:hypothetical protein
MESLTNIIKKNKNISLSDSDLKRLVHGRAKVVIYDKLYQYHNLDELLEPYGAVFLLYLFKPRYGHWTAIIKRNNKTVEFFDSYGQIPDDVLNHIPLEFRKKTNQDYPYLSRLLWESPYNIEYNEHHFQKHDKNIKTCGRFAALRVIFRHLTLNKFCEIFDRAGKYSDDLATYFTM